jgi:hypothetical protein
MASIRGWATALGIISGLCLMHPGRVEAWETRVDGTLPGWGSWAAGLTLDPSGNVIATGMTENTETAADFTVVKLSPLDGAEIWRQTIDGTEDDTPGVVSDEADDVAVDSVGDVFAAGTLRSAGTQTDSAVIKLAGDTGTEIWRRVFDGGLHTYDSAASIALDPAGDVFAVCTLANTNVAGNFTVLKLAGATGAELWRQDIHGTSEDLPGYKGSRGNAVAVDRAGDVVVAGSTSNVYENGRYIEATYADFTVVKLAGPTGAELWRLTIGGPFSEYASSVAVDDDGDVIAAGYITVGFLPSWPMFTVVKVAGSDGTLLWGRLVGKPKPSAAGKAVTVRIDTAGDVVASGSIGDAFTVMKLRGANGDTIWQRQRTFGLAISLALDSRGDVLAIGFTGHSRFAVRKFRGRDGRILWRRTLPRAGSLYGGQGLDIVVNTAGNVIASGMNRDSFTVIKACGRNGRTRTEGCPPLP